MSAELPKVAQEQKWTDAIAKSVDVLRRVVRRIEELKLEIDILSHELSEIGYVPSTEFPAQEELPNVPVE